MVIDTSVVLCLLLREPEAERFEAAISRSDIRLISAASVLEAAIIVQQRFGETGGRELDQQLSRWPVEIVPVELDQWKIGTAGYLSDFRHERE